MKFPLFNVPVCLFPGVQCPLHSHYELCGSGCEVTCESLAPPAGCRSLCTEGCVCDQGFIRSGNRCVPLAQCGCVYGSRYYLLYQKFYPANNCEEVCICSPDGQVRKHTPVTIERINHCFDFVMWLDLIFRVLKQL